MPLKYEGQGILPATRVSQQTTLAFWPRHATGNRKERLHAPPLPPMAAPVDFSPVSILPSAISPLPSPYPSNATIAAHFFSATPPSQRSVPA
jgi:hypothetical protein